MNGLYALASQSSRENYYSDSKNKTVTEAEYWDKYYHNSDVIYEWNNAYLEEKPVSDFLTLLMSNWFSELLSHFLRVHPIAKKTFLEMGFRLPLSHKATIRKPDFGIVLNSNPVPLNTEDKTYHGIFDLCIEALSDSSNSEITRDTVTKKAEYAAVGVKEYYILYGHEGYMEFYHLNASGVYVPMPRGANDIIKSTVLPGFQFRIADLYRQPSPDELIDDPVYQSFVLPAYSQAKQTAKAEKRARKKAERKMNTEKQARKKAEAEIARLKALLKKTSHSK